ncbi:hypothetical protein [Nostoc sp. FACHB-110]|uniref:hypothetical protein n=1 Tax=Nostoc sp. FACHB-110 TaxID=2692834 RepID=UPI001688C692|nr:hypothetical protein [Nostoc sp. FACHB-110]MBD2439431.1 hypothetical protein [Nostoc sp. FACHB-110]
MTRNVVYQRSSIIPFLFISQIAQRIRIFPLIFLLLSTVPVWFAAEIMSSQIVRAYTARVDLIIDRLPDENYETTLRRAEATARAAAQRSFDQDILATDVSIIVSVQSYGAIAPILSLEVSRPQWRSRPDTQRWATYFKTARSLLFFEKTPTNSPTLAPINTVAPPAQPAKTPPVPGAAPPPSEPSANPANQPQ